MTASNSQMPWTDEQWARVNQVIQEEASRARVAARFLPLIGPLPADTDFVREEAISYPARQATPPQQIAISDRDTVKLATLQVKVEVRSAQLADPEMRSVLDLFRRAANVLARLEDVVVFRGLIPIAAGRPDVRPGGGLGQLPQIWEIRGGQVTPGLWQSLPARNPPWNWIGANWTSNADTGQGLVTAISAAIGKLEEHGHFGPFATVLGQELFVIAQTPDKGSLVLPQDRIIPFLGGGPLLRSSTLDDQGGYTGVVVALGGAPIELVVAKDMSLQFLQVTQDPRFLFRVREKIALRIKEADAIVRLYPIGPVPPPAAAGGTGAAGGAGGGAGAGPAGAGGPPSRPGPKQ